jgi:hypothetical protein
MIKSNIEWIDEHAPELKGDAREANTKGVLGIYFGDKLEGLHAIGMDSAFGCMPLYKKRPAVCNM